MEDYYGEFKSVHLEDETVVNVRATNTFGRKMVEITRSGMFGIQTHHMSAKDVKEFALLLINAYGELGDDGCDPKEPQKPIVPKFGIRCTEKDIFPEGFHHEKE